MVTLSNGEIYMKLSTLLKSLNIIDHYNEVDCYISGIAYHTERVQKNHLFVCMKGYETDGHLFLEDAMKKGATVAIVEEFNMELPITQYLVENSRVALAQLAATYYDNPSTKMTTIGITATNGKTTTAFMTDAILEAHGYQTGLIGTINVKMGHQLIQSELTTPESLDLQHFFHAMEEKDTSHVIMEVSSAAQEMHRVDMVDFDIVTLNNINREHIDTHGSFAAYVQAKTRLIKEADKDSIAILNLDCKYTDALLKQTEATPITFSIEEESGHVCIRDLDLSTGRAKFNVTVLKPIHTNHQIIKPMEFPIELAIPGLHSVSNSMIAILISMLNGVPVTTIQKTLKEFKGVSRRFEFIYEKGLTVIDDHFANPGNIDVTMETISLMDYRHLQLVYAVRGQRGAVVNQENGETLVKWAKQLQMNEIIVTRSISDVTHRDEVTDAELHAFVKEVEAAGINVLLYDELADAIHKGIEKSSKDDLLLLAGCQGMDHGGEIALTELRNRPKN